MKSKKIIIIFLSLCILFSNLHLNMEVQAIEFSDETQLGYIEETEEIEPIILNEDISERNEYEKTFVMSDKSMQTILYSIPIHYEENGIWEEIDNSFVESEVATIAEDGDSLNVIENKKSKTKIKFAKKMHKSNLVSVSIDDYSVVWGLQDFTNKSNAVVDSNEENNNDVRLKVYDKINQSITYEEVFDNISLQYAINSKDIKENIVLKEKQDRNNFTFTYKTKNLSLLLNENGEIEMIDSKTEELIFLMPKPFMYDSDNKYSYDVSYSLIQNNKDSYTIVIQADKEWINDVKRKYPIVIDPIIQTETTQNAIDTTFITSWQPTVNHSSKFELLVGTETSEYGYCRTLVKFALPLLNKGDMIVDAQLYMASYSHSFLTSSIPDLQVNAHMTTSDWNVSTVNWNSRPSYETMVQDYDFIKKQIR